MLKFKGKRKKSSYELEKENKLVERAILVSLPPAVALLVLNVFEFISPSIAIMCFGTILILNIALMFPLIIELQEIKNYVNLMTREDFNPDIDNLDVMEDDVKDIVSAINNVHKFWASKNSELESQTISDTAVLDSLPDPVLMIDNRGNITGANLAARDSFGHNIRDTKIDELFNSHQFIKTVHSVLNDGIDSDNLVFYLKKPWNKKLYAHIKKLPWVSKSETVAVISIYDLTKSMKIEKMQSDFVANASHELRTPLSVIMGFIDTIKTSAKDDAEATEMFLNIMQEQATHMNSLIENLLSLSKIEMNFDKNPTEFISLSELADKAVKALKLKAKDKNIVIDTEIIGVVPEIIADKNQIKQIFQNLVDNAIKYGDKDSTIRILISPCNSIPQSKSYKVSDKKAVSISINNRGNIIPQEKIGRLTERFYRLQNHRDLNIKGTGLGLSIVKHIIINHQGNLTVNSTEENGTTFTIYLPVKL